MSPTDNSITRSGDSYIYGVGAVFVVAIGTYVFFKYNLLKPRIKSKPRNYL